MTHVSDLDNHEDLRVAKQEAAISLGCREGQKFLGLRELMPSTQRCSEKEW